MTKEFFNEVVSVFMGHYKPYYTELFNADLQTIAEGSCSGETLFIHTRNKVLEYIEYDGVGIDDAINRLVKIRDTDRKNIINVRLNMGCASDYYDEDEDCDATEHKTIIEIVCDEYYNYVAPLYYLNRLKHYLRVFLVFNPDSKKGKMLMEEYYRILNGTNTPTHNPDILNYSPN